MTLARNLNWFRRILLFAVLLSLVPIVIIVVWDSVSRSSNTSSSTLTSSTPNSGKIIAPHYWLMTNTAFNSITKDQVAASRLKHDIVYLIGGGPISGYDIIPTIDVKDISQMPAILASRATFVKAVVYDDESWIFTPLNQISTQTEISSSFDQAAKLAHQSGLQLIGTPALDISKVLKPSGSCGSKYWQEYLCNNLPSIAAEYSNIIDIQSQSLIQTPTDFLSLIQQASKASKVSNPNIIVLAGLSTCSGSPSSDQLASAAVASDSYVNGWWLNVPGNSADSPDCQTPNPSLAAEAIDKLPWY